LVSSPCLLLTLSFESPCMNLPLAQQIASSHSYQSYQRQRQLTLGDLLLENRIVFLQGEIHYANANDVVMKLLYLQSENRRKDIKVLGGKN